MARGTFANIRLVNKFIGKAGPKTVHFPSNEEVQYTCLTNLLYVATSACINSNVFNSQMSVFDAAEKYRSEGRSLIILAGKDYGSGSSRDWAAKGPWMLVRLNFSKGTR